MALDVSVSTRDGEVTAPRQQRPAPPCAIVIFGASGDLTHRKLIPALFDLVQGRAARQAVRGPRLLALGRSATRTSGAPPARASSSSTRRRARPARWQEFSRRAALHVRAVRRSGELSKRSRERLTDIDASAGTGGNRLFYLATPPELFADHHRAARATAELHDRTADARLRRAWSSRSRSAHDLDSARALNQAIARCFSESQVYRIDHYLGKETVQNILAFRFGQRDLRADLEPQLRRPRADHRGRDGRRRAARRLLRADRRVPRHGQNHMLQLLAHRRDGAAGRLRGRAVRDEKLKVLQGAAARSRPSRPASTRSAASTPPAPSAASRSRAIAARRRSRRIRGPRRSSRCKLHIDNWRWAGAPFYLRHGKRLPKRATEIAIQFKRAPQMFFAGRGAPRAERAGDAHPARRGHLAALRRQGARARRCSSRKSTWTSATARRSAQRATSRRLRAPAARRDARRSHAVHPRRRGRASLEVGRGHSGRLE